MQVLTPEELNNWLRDPATKKILAALKNLEADITEKWIEGVFKGHAEAEFHRGMIHGINTFFSIPTVKLEGEK